MKESMIRPEHLMKEMSEIRQKDLCEILSNEGKFIHVSCPACNSKKSSFAFKKEGFNFVNCNECETLFINPRPSLNILFDFYNNSEGVKHWNSKVFPQTEESRRENIFKPRAELTAHICKKSDIQMDTLVDVGAGFGTFCEEIKKINLFKNVIAIEPSSAYAQTCLNKGLCVIQKPIEEVKLDNVNVITNFELIEHLFDPKQFIEDCYNVLSKNGLFILTTPNVKGFDLSILGELSNNISGPTHLNYFNIESLTFLLSSKGFKVLEVLTPGKLDAELVRKKVLSRELNLSNVPFLEYVLIDKWDEIGLEFQNFLSANKLSSHLWVVAQKVMLPKN